MLSDLQRLPDWENKWGEFIAGFAREPFEWGRNDCMLVGGANLEVLTGKDIWTQHVGKYSTEIGAFKYLKKTVGYDDCEAFWGDHLPNVPVAQAGRGDLIIYTDCIGICLGAQSMFKCEESVDLVPTLECDKAWKI